MLLEELTERKRRNPSYSLNAFSRSLGISAPSLSQILSGKRPLSKKAAAKIMERCLFSPARRQAFLESAFDTPENKEVDQEDNFRELEMDYFNVVADWYHFAILSLGDLPENRWDPKWIAQKLGISSTEALQGLQRLLRLGLIHRRGRGFFQCTPPLKVPTRPNEAALKKHHQQNLRKAEEALEDPKVPLEFFSSITMAIDETKLPEARELTKKFRRELCRLLETGSRTRVFTLAVQMIPISEGKTP